MSRQLRIVHCFRSPVGGIFRHVRDLAEAQAAAGHLVGIVCDSTTGGPFEARIFDEIGQNLSLGIHRTPMQRHIGIGDVAAAFRAWRLVGRLKPDVLHGHGAKGGAYSRLLGTLARAAGRRVARIYTPHGGSLHYNESTATGKLFFALEALMGRFSDQLLFVSDYERRTYVRKVGEPRAPATLVHNGLRSEEFVPVADRPDATDLLYVGMMRKLKGPDLFLDALALASARLGRPLSAVMVGDGEDLAEYREQAARLGPAAQVRFLPAMPAREAFALGRVMVVPSRAEAMPYIVLEALAAGKPVIASAVGGIPEILGQGSPALAEPDADALGERMAAALADEAGWRASMPDPDLLSERFGAAAMAAAIESRYLAALDPLP